MGESHVETVVMGNSQPPAMKQIVGMLTTDSGIIPEPHKKPTGDKTVREGRQEFPQLLRLSLKVEKLFI